MRQSTSSASSDFCVIDCSFFTSLDIKKKIPPPSFLLGKWSTLNKGNYVQCIWTFVEWVNTRMNESLKFDFCRKPMLINIGRPTVVVVTVWWHLGGRLNTPLWGKFGDLMVAPTWRACWGHKQEFGREWQPTPQTPNWATSWTETGMPWSIWQKRVANGSTPGGRRISTLKSSAFNTLWDKTKLSKMQVQGFPKLGKTNRD